MKRLGRSNRGPLKGVGAESRVETEMGKEREGKGKGFRRLLYGWEVNSSTLCSFVYSHSCLFDEMRREGR